MASKIEWLARPGTTPESWNFIGGCTPVSAGCLNCYAARTAATRLKHHPRYEGLTCWKDGRPTWTGEIRLDQDALKKPLSWKKPRTVFVASMSDLFHEGIPHWFVDDVFSQMFVCDQHTFLVLTKRPERMLRYWKTKSYTPPSNVWLGVTVENDDNLRRVEHLLQTPAAVRYVSYEPALTSVDFSQFLDLETIWDEGTFKYRKPPGHEFCSWRKLDWLICAGESSPHARPMHPDWARQVRDQCQAAGIPFFFKGWGAYVPGEFDHQAWRFVFQNGWVSAGEDNLWFGPVIYGKKRRLPFHFRGDDILSIRVGKKAAGRLLDGKEHSEWPR